MRTCAPKWKPETQSDWFRQLRLEFCGVLLSRSRCLSSLKTNSWVSFSTQRLFFKYYWYWAIEDKTSYRGCLHPLFTLRPPPSPLSCHIETTPFKKNQQQLFHSNIFSCWLVYNLIIFQVEMVLGKTQGNYLYILSFVYEFGYSLVHVDSGLCRPCIQVSYLFCIKYNFPVTSKLFQIEPRFFQKKWFEIKSIDVLEWHI